MNEKITLYFKFTEFLRTVVVENNDKVNQPSIVTFRKKTHSNCYKNATLVKQLFSHAKEKGRMSTYGLYAHTALFFTVYCRITDAFINDLIVDCSFSISQIKNYRFRHFLSVLDDKYIPPLDLKF